MYNNYEYQILIKHEDNTISFLSVNNRNKWKIKTAAKHLKTVINEKLDNNPKWHNVRYFTAVQA